MVKTQNFRERVKNENTRRIIKRVNGVIGNRR